MKLSIIVPAYKVERFISQCLESCINQDIAKEDYEIIVVDDGSPDSSYEIAHKLEATHPIIRIIRQENQGLSMARNHGLAEAQGEWVWFIDSDDWIKENCLGMIVEEMERTKASIMRINGCFEDQPKRGQCHYQGKKSWEEALGYQFEACVPFYIYKRAFLEENQLTFTPKIYFEDSEFTPRALRAAGELAYLDKTLYFVRKNEQSITHTASPKKAFDALTIAIKQDEDFKEELQRGCPIMSYHIAHNIVSALRFVRGAAKSEIGKLWNILGSHKSLINHFFKIKSVKYRIYGLFLWHMIH